MGAIVKETEGAYLSGPEGSPAGSHFGLPRPPHGAGSGCSSPSGAEYWKQQTRSSHAIVIQNSCTICAGVSASGSSGGRSMLIKVCSERAVSTSRPHKEQIQRLRRTCVTHRVGKRTVQAYAQRLASDFELHGGVSLQCIVCLVASVWPSALRPPFHRRTSRLVLQLGLYQQLLG